VLTIKFKSKVCTNPPLNWYKLLIKTLSSTLKTVFTHRCHDAMTVTRKMHHFYHFISEHYKVSKSEVGESLLMSCAKNSKNWWKCVKAMATQTWDIF